jgi:hypothetical protein
MIESLIFGFGHRARHGKDTVASEIVKRRAGNGPGWYDVRVYSFAKELKDEVNVAALRSGGMQNLFADGLREPGAGYLQTNGNFISLPDWVQYESNPDMSDPLCPLGKQRTLLQWWGTEYRRSVDPDYWVKRLAARLEKDKPEIALLTDMRFPNEMRFVQEYGDAIKVERRNPDSSLYVAPGVIPHPSEEALAHLKDNEWDAILTNDGTLDELKDAGVLLFDTLMERVEKGTITL